MTPHPTLLLLNPVDSVAVARIAIPAGTVLPLPDGGTVISSQAVPAGHKIAVKAMAVDAVVRKYGQVIGVATRAIAAGDHVHTHNIDMGSSHPAHGIGRAYVPTHAVAEPATFEGYVRADGSVEKLDHIGSAEMQPGDVFVIETPGGGGFGEA